jgi:hypothetical protein
VIPVARGRAGELGAAEVVVACGRRFRIAVELYARIRRKAIERFEDDDLDGAEHYCRDAERVLAGEHLETGADK